MISWPWCQMLLKLWTDCWKKDAGWALVDAASIKAAADVILDNRDKEGIVCEKEEQGVFFFMSLLSWSCRETIVRSVSHHGAAVIYTLAIPLSCRSIQKRLTFPYWGCCLEKWISGTSVSSTVNASVAWMVSQLPVWQVSLAETVLKDSSIALFQEQSSLFLFPHQGKRSSSCFRLQWRPFWTTKVRNGGHSECWNMANVRWATNQRYPMSLVLSNRMASKQTSSLVNVINNMPVYHCSSTKGLQGAYGWRWRSTTSNKWINVDVRGCLQMDDMKLAPCSICMLRMLTFMWIKALVYALVDRDHNMQLQQNWSLLLAAINAILLRLITIFIYDYCSMAHNNHPWNSVNWTQHFHQLHLNIGLG